MPSLSSEKTQAEDRPGGDRQESLSSWGVARRFLRGLKQWAGSAWRYTVHTPTLWIPLLILFGATLFFRLSKADLECSRSFYLGVHWSKAPVWPLGFKEPWIGLYRFGVLPAWILGLGGLAAWLAGCFCSKLRRYRDAGLFLALMLALGPGLLINGILKPLSGRPRPYSTVPFGGENEFLPVLSVGERPTNLSFPSGHASMGFYLMAPAFVLYRRRPRWAAAFLLIGLAAGTLMGLTRIVAGSHFASDVLWSAGVVYFTGLALLPLFDFGRDRPAAETRGGQPRRPRPRIGTECGAGCAE
jgi:lipid A 4'-phosphatase